MPRAWKAGGLGQLWAAFGPSKYWAVVLFFVLILAALAEATSLGMVLPLLEAVLSEDLSSSGLLPYFEVLGSILPGLSLLAIVCLVAFVLIVMKNGLILLRALLSKRFLVRLRQYWSCNILENYLFSEYRWLVKHKHGVMLYNVVNEPSFAAKCLRDLTDLLAKAFLSVFLVVALFWASWQTASLTAIVGGGLAFLQWGISRRYSYAIGKKRVQLNQEAAGLAGESLAGARQLKIFCAEQKSIDTFRQRLRHLLDLIVRIEVVQELPKVVGEIVIVALLIGVLLYCLGVRGDEPAAIIPKVGLFVVCGQRLLTNLSGFLSQRIAVISYWPSLKLVSELAESREFREDRGGRKRLVSLRDGVLFRDVGFSYGDGRVLFDGINLDFPKGEMVAVVGPSGSGKSTVCDLLVGLRRPDRGGIFVDGEDLATLDIRSWRAHVGYVPQETFLFNASIRENILYGKPDADEATVLWAARAAGVDDFVNMLPQGYDTVVGERGVGLSGGQQQRVAIARALVRNPQVLVLDEATSALDSQSEERIFSLVEPLRKGRAIVIVSHSLRWLKACDRIYVMEDGQVVESGRYDELMELDGLFARLERLSFEVKEKTEVLET